MQAVGVCRPSAGVATRGQCASAGSRRHGLHRSRPNNLIAKSFDAVFSSLLRLLLLAVRLVCCLGRMTVCWAAPWPAHSRARLLL